LQFDLLVSCFQCGKCIQHVLFSSGGMSGQKQETWFGSKVVHQKCWCAYYYVAAVMYVDYLKEASTTQKPHFCEE
jgi:hypothetical protein